MGHNNLLFFCHSDLAEGLLIEARIEGSECVHGKNGCARKKP